jgi:hypothetical protein
MILEATRPVFASNDLFSGDHLHDQGAGKKHEPAKSTNMKIAASTTGRNPNPISQPPIACSHDLCGGAAFAFQNARALNGAQTAIETMTEPTLWHSPSILTVQPDQAFAPLIASSSAPRTPRAINDPSPSKNARFVFGSLDRAPPVASGLIDIYVFTVVPVRHCP